MRKKIAELFIARAEQLGYKGKTREKMALEFVTGAACALSCLEPPQDISKFAWLVSIRGYSAVEDAAKSETA